MPRARANRTQMIAKAIAFIEATIREMYPDKPKPDTTAMKAYTAMQRALMALREAAQYQAAHTAEIMRNMEALKTELAQ